VHPGDGSAHVSELDLPLGLISSEALAIAERRLAEARVARDRLAFSLPPSRARSARGHGSAGGRLHLADRPVTDRGTRDIEAVRVEPSSDEPSDAAVETPVLRRFLPPLPVAPIFLDLPLLTGTEVEHAPHLAVAATPWPGAVAVYSAAGTDGYTLNRVVERGAVAGTLLTPLLAAAPGLWDRGPAFRVQIAGGALSSAEASAVLNGANVGGDRIGRRGGLGGDPVPPRRGLSPRMSGRSACACAGRRARMPTCPPEWPEGSLFVLLDGAVGQVSLPASARGLARHWRVGPARRVARRSELRRAGAGLPGIGLRPLGRCTSRPRRWAGTWRVSWIRRGRIDADSWEGLDVPLGEAAELYHLRIVDAAGLLKREIDTAVPPSPTPPRCAAADGTRRLSPSKSPSSPTVSGRAPMQGSRSMTETANLALPLVQPAQAQKHVTVNEALARLDGLTQLTSFRSARPCRRSARPRARPMACPPGAVSLGGPWLAMWPSA
jgi:hypothetical protein